MEHTYPKKNLIVVFLEFKFNWASVFLFAKSGKTKLEQGFDWKSRRRKRLEIDPILQCFFFYKTILKRLKVCSFWVVLLCLSFTCYLLLHFLNDDDGYNKNNGGAVTEHLLCTRCCARNAFHASSHLILTAWGSCMAWWWDVLRLLRFES